MTTWDTDFTGGARLRRARNWQRLSQTQLAQALGVHKNTIVRWENGVDAPTPALRKVTEGFIQNAERLMAQALIPTKRFTPLPVAWVPGGADRAV